VESGYGGGWAWQADDPRRLKELKRENQRLKRMVADQALDIYILKEVKCGKFLRSTRRLAAVDHSTNMFLVSQHRVCRLIEQPRFTQRLSPVVPCDFEQALRARLRELAKARPRFGYRRLHAPLVREGFGVNHKRVQRLCRDEGLRVGVKNRGPARLGHSTIP